MKLLDRAALTVTIIGAVNWLLIAIFNFNLVESIFGSGTTASQVVYILVGLSALWTIKYFSYTPDRTYKRRRK